MLDVFQNLRKNNCLEYFPKNQQSGKIMVQNTFHEAIKVDKFIVENKIQLVCIEILYRKYQQLEKQEQMRGLMHFILNQTQLKQQQNTKMYLEKDISIVLSRKPSVGQPIINSQKGILQINENRLTTVPIKEYSNKFLREKRKQDQECNTTKKQPFPNSHLHNNRKLISEFKKYKGRNKKFVKTANKQNGDFIIHNLLFEKEIDSNGISSVKNNRKTIFGAFTQTIQSHPHRTVISQNNMFQKRWVNFNNQESFLAKKEVYDKICQKEHNSIPEYRKKCKTFTDIISGQSEYGNKQKQLQRISTSRALQKYSKIIKINPQQGKVQKMRIKKDLAKSIRFQGSEQTNIQTKQITLSRKQLINNKHRSSFMNRKKEACKNHQSIQNGNKQNCSDISVFRTPEKVLNKSVQQQFVTDKVGLFTSGRKPNKPRKYSHQAQCDKKCKTEERKQNDINETFQDFQLNGWDINF